MNVQNEELGFIDFAIFFQTCVCVVWSQRDTIKDDLHEPCVNVFGFECGGFIEEFV